jgi:hypothetical protein
MPATAPITSAAEFEPTAATISAAKRGATRSGRAIIKPLIAPLSLGESFIEHYEPKSEPKSAEATSSTPASNICPGAKQRRARRRNAAHRRKSEGIRQAAIEGVFGQRD